MLYTVKNNNTSEVAVLEIIDVDAWTEAVSIMKTENIELIKVSK